MNGGAVTGPPGPTGVTGLVQSRRPTPASGILAPGLWIDGALAQDLLNLLNLAESFERTRLSGSLPPRLAVLRDQCAAVTKACNTPSSAIGTPEFRFRTTCDARGDEHDRGCRCVGNEGPQRHGARLARDPGYPEPWIDPGSENKTHTTHVAVIDAAGNAVAVTCTIELPFGSAVVPVGLGFLLNGQLTDFMCVRATEGAACDPASPNAPSPAKRPRSSMSPTIVVRQGKPMLNVGGAGGPTIIMGVLQAVTNAVDFHLDPGEAVDAPRVDCCAFHANKVMIENGRISDAVVKELGTAHAQGGRGHLLAIDPSAPLNYADAPELQAAGVNVRTNERLGASDPRGECGAAAHDANGTIVYQCSG
jgi:hypothetical protein